MKKMINLTAILLALSTLTFAQEKDKREHVNVPAAVASAFHKKYAEAKKVTWEKEDGNYEANWGGKSGEDNSVQFTPSGNFIEIVNAIAINRLPANVITYLKQHYKAKITEAGKVTDANGKLYYEAEIHGKDILFDENGNFIKEEY